MTTTVTLFFTAIVSFIYGFFNKGPHFTREGSWQETWDRTSDWLNIPLIAMPALILGAFAFLGWRIGLIDLVLTIMMFGAGFFIRELIDL